MKSNTLVKTVQSVCVSAILMSGISFSQNASSDELLRLAENLCQAAKNNDRSGMRKKLKLANIRLKNVYFGIQCGSAGSLLRVATENSAIDAATYIATKVGRKGITEKESDGKNIVEWTENLVSSGDAGKQAFVELYKSKI